MHSHRQKSRHRIRHVLPRESSDPLQATGQRAEVPEVCRAALLREREKKKKGRREKRERERGGSLLDPFIWAWHCHRYAHLMHTLSFNEPNCLRKSFLFLSLSTFFLTVPRSQFLFNFSFCIATIKFQLFLCRGVDEW